jgi:hypothetical protein
MFGLICDEETTEPGVETVSKNHRSVINDIVKERETSVNGEFENLPILNNRELLLNAGSNCWLTVSFSSA